MDFYRKNLPEDILLPEESSLDTKKVSQNYSRYFALVMYLCTADRDILGPVKARKLKNLKNPKKQKRLLPVEYRVGTAIGGAIRRARANQGIQTPGEGVKKAPHIRRSHYHTYWVGPGRKTPILKLIPPVPVNIGDEPVVPIIRRVK
ncbi:MAG: hypothetical protein GY710_13210 [Desulfobacteraceae bacterium]|nr:hypothetical protein [Desulfobacteraceae bacterium]